MADTNFEIKEHLATIEGKGTWKLEVNKVSWYGRTPTVDIRQWNEDHTKCGKGLSVTEEQAVDLCDALTLLFKKA